MQLGVHKTSIFIGDYICNKPKLLFVQFLIDFGEITNKISQLEFIPHPLVLPHSFYMHFFFKFYFCKEDFRLISGVTNESIDILNFYVIP